MYMLFTTSNVGHIESLIKVKNYSFRVVSEFIKLGSAVTNKTDVNLEIKHAITLANSCNLIRRELYFTSSLSFLRRRSMETIKSQSSRFNSIREKSPT